MDNTVTVEVTSAFLVEGEVALPGSQVSLPRAEALALVARGKARLMNHVDAEETESGATPGGNGDDQDAVQPGQAPAAGKGKRGKG